MERNLDGKLKRKWKGKTFSYLIKMCFTWADVEQLYTALSFRPSIYFTVYLDVFCVQHHIFDITFLNSQNQTAKLFTFFFRNRIFWFKFDLNFETLDLTLPFRVKCVQTYLLRHQLIKQASFEYNFFHCFSEENRSMIYGSSGKE